MSRPFLAPPTRRMFMGSLAAAGAGLAAAAPRARRGPRRFSRRCPPSKSGITFVHENAMSPERYLPETMGPGVAFLDYDGDGWMDLYLVNSGPCDFFQPKTPLRNALYRNNRDGTFTDVTEKAGVAGGTFGMGVAVGDYDNDGHPDLLVTSYGRCILYRNNGDGTFTDVTEKAGLAAPGWYHERRLVRLRRRRPARPLPLQLRRVRDHDRTSSAATTSSAAATTASRASSSPTASLLFHNNGDGTFTEVTQGTDIATALGKALGVVATDVNNDGRLDLFVANDTVQNFLFVNRGKDKWDEIGLASEVGFSANGQPRSGMGVDAADVDGDGWQDLFVANVDQEMFALYQNNRDESFLDTANVHGIGQATRLLSGWGLKFFDFDNDGRLDLFLANGHPDDMVDQYGGAVKYEEPLLLFRSDGRSCRTSARRRGPSSSARSPRAGWRWATSTTTAGSTCSSATTARRRSCCATARARATTGWACGSRARSCNRDAVGARLTWSVNGVDALAPQDRRRQLPLVARPARGHRPGHRREARLARDQVAGAQHAGGAPRRRSRRPLRARRRRQGYRRLGGSPCGSRCAVARCCSRPRRAPGRSRRRSRRAFPRRPRRSRWTWSCSTATASRSAA